MIDADAVSDDEDDFDDDYPEDATDEEIDLVVGLYREDGLPVASFATHYSGLAPISGRTRHHLRLEIPALPLAKGNFSLVVFLLDEQGLHVYDQRHIPDAFAVISPRFVPGLVEMAHVWHPG